MRKICLKDWQSERTLITKPFSVGILKATVKNILTNRALLRQFYNCIEDKEQNLPVNCTGTLDWKFIASVKECIEDNMGSPLQCRLAQQPASHEPYQFF